MTLTRVTNAMLKDAVTPQQFGAAGDGVTDDTAAIQAALAGGSKKVFFPKGDYLCSSTLTIPDNVVIEGESAIESRLKSGGTGLVLFERAANEIATNVIFRDLGFDGDDNYVAGQAQAIRMRSYSNVVIEGCDFTKWQVAAVIVGVPDTPNTGKDFVFRGNRVDGGGVAVPFSGIHVFNANRAWIEDNYFQRVARPIDFEMNTNSVAENVWVTGNFWENCQVSSHSATNTYKGINFTTDAATSEAFNNVYIEGNISKNNTHDDGAGGATAQVGYDIQIFDPANYDFATGAGAKNIFIGSHKCLGFTGRHSGSDNWCILVQAVFSPQIGTIELDDPQVAGVTAVRLRDTPGASFEQIIARDGTAQWTDVLREVNSEAVALNMVRGTLTGASGASLLDDFSSGNRNKALVSRAADGNKTTSSTTTNNPIMSKSMVAGSIPTGAQITLRAEGQFSGAFGNKTVGARFNGADIGKFTVSTGASDHFTIECRIYVIDNTSLAYMTQLSYHGSGASPTNSAGSGAVTSLDFSTNDYDLELVGYVANAADQIRARVVEMRVERLPDNQ